LEDRADWEVCGETDNGEKAVNMAEQLNPDVIIMDVSMPVMGGLEAAREISNLTAHIPVLMFTLLTTGFGHFAENAVTF
jgi:chemotaxis response regulator CheB